jgi:glucose-6-phosphate isomerase
MRMELDTATMKLLYDDSILALFKDGEKLTSNTRRLEEMEDVLLDRNFFEQADKGMILYYMFRDVHREEDEAILRRNMIRYDVTIIPPRILGEEYVKTAGHYHPEAKNGLTYTEIYEVLRGEAHYLLQDVENEGIASVLLVEAKKGDKVVIPPNYGHVTINPSEETLIMTNLVSSAFQSVYVSYREHKGAAYFELKDGTFKKNENYGKLPALQRLRAEKREQFPADKDLYTLFIGKPDLFKFLNEPDEYYRLLNR